MPIMKKTLLALIVTNVMILSLSAQEIQVYEDLTLDKDIHTVRMHQEGWELSWPYYELNSDSKLSLNFDDLKEDPRDFEYTIVHCDQNWKKSDLFFSDYIDGFERNPLDNYDLSVNTFVPYTHYNLTLPNENIEFRISGNYAVLVFATDEPKIPVLIRRFMVIENEISINAEVKQPVLGLYKTLGQDVRFSLKTDAMEFNNIFEDLNVCVVQNYQWETAQCNIQPDFVNNDEVVFHRDDQAVFKAINEYRILNIRNLKFTNERVAKIQFEKPDYFVTLYPDKDNQFMQYLDREDFNGRFFISNRDGWEETAAFDADYVHVLFRVPARYNLMPETVHIYGEMTDWRVDESTKMLYDETTGMYEKELLIKQGAYSYRYVLKKGETIDHMRFEGSHWETENDYMIIVYFRDVRLGADRIIGFQIVNSHK